MSKTSARFNLADISRATKAAKAEGAAAVEVLPDGTIRIVINEMHCDEKPETEDDERDLADALYSARAVCAIFERASAMLERRTIFRPPRAATIKRAVSESALGRCCRKSLFASLNTNSPSRRRGDLINVWGEAS